MRSFVKVTTVELQEQAISLQVETNPSKNPLLSLTVTQKQQLMEQIPDLLIWPEGQVNGQVYHGFQKPFIPLIKKRLKDDKASLIHAGLRH